MSSESQPIEWVCAQCDERINLVRTSITNRQTGVKRIKLACLACGFRQTKELADVKDG